MKALNEDLKSGNLKQIYLFYGEESYLRRQYLKRFKKALVSDDDEMNYHYYEGNDISVSEFIDMAETLPFFSNRRVIIWENSGLFKSTDEKMIEYIKTVPESTSVLFVETEVDKKRKMFKYFSSVGSAVEFPPQDEKTLLRWIGSLLKKENKQISERSALYLLNKAGMDMENIYTEVEKLICYCLERNVVTEADIDAVCITHINTTIFNMIGAVAEKRQQEALKLYYDLLALKEPPMRILYFITRQFRTLLQVRELKDKGYDNRSIASRIGLNPYIAGKCASQAAKFKPADLKEAMNDCALADESVKTGKMNDRMSVELLIVKYS